MTHKQCRFEVKAVYDFQCFAETAVRDCFSSSVFCEKKIPWTNQFLNTIELFFVQSFQEPIMEFKVNCHNGQQEVKSYTVKQQLFPLNLMQK